MVSSYMILHFIFNYLFLIVFIYVYMPMSVSIPVDGLVYMYISVRISTDVQSPGVRVTGNCKSLDVVLNSSSLHEQYILFSAEPSLQSYPQFLFFETGSLTGS